MGKQLRIVTLHKGREIKGLEGEQLRILWSRNLQAALEQRPTRALCRHDPPDRSSIRRLVEAIEARLVSALWTLSRLPNGGSGGRCGIAYIHDRAEIFANAVARGDWGKMRPGSPLPKEIDAMHEPMTWLSWLPRDLATIVRAAAASKRGRPDCNVAWGLVRDQVPEARGMTIRTLQRRYDAGLRAIAIRKAFD